MKNIFYNALGIEHFCISKNMVVTGSVQTDGNGQISGTINGDITINGKLIVKKEAIINGDISASIIVVSGKIMGDIVCSGKLTLKSNANIKGSIRTLEIQVEKDAFVDGIITKTSESNYESTDTETAITESFAENSIAKKIKAEPPPETWF